MSFTARVKYMDDMSRGKWGEFTTSGHPTEESARRHIMECLQPSPMSPNVKWKDLVIEEDND